MRTIKRDGAIEFIIGGRGFYAGRVYQNDAGKFKALPRGLSALPQEFGTENEAISALWDWFRQNSPARRRALKPALTHAQPRDTRPAGKRRGHSRAGAITVRRNGPVRQPMESLLDARELQG